MVARARARAPRARAKMAATRVLLLVFFFFFVGGGPTQMPAVVNHTQMPLAHHSTSFLAFGACERQSLGKGGKGVAQRMEKSSRWKAPHFLAGRWCVC